MYPLRAISNIPFSGKTSLTPLSCPENSHGILGIFLLKWTYSCQGLMPRDILFQSGVKKHVASLAREELKTQLCFSYRLPPIKGGTNLGTRRIFPVVLKPARVFSITASRAPSPLPAPSFPITPPSLRFNLKKSSSSHGSLGCFHEPPVLFQGGKGYPGALPPSSLPVSKTDLNGDLCSPSSTAT